MRRSLLTAAAIAPLVLACGAPAMAATTISGSQTTPVKTSTANNGGPDDVTITGSLTITAPVAVTLDSNNALTNSGTISIKDVDNSTGVLILGGHTGSFTNSGGITVSESYTPTDTNKDGVPDGNYAQGTGRYGLRVTGPTAFTGGVTLSPGGSITVQGNSSYGVSLEAPLQGDVLAGNLIAVTGGNTSWTNPIATPPPAGQVFGISESGGVSGKVRITGGVTATGGGAVGVDVAGNIGGALSIYSPIVATGYRQTQRSTDPSLNALLQPSDLLQSGSAVSVRADVAGGVFIGAQPVGTVATDTTTDADKDGIVDSL